MLLKGSLADIIGQLTNLQPISPATYLETWTQAPTCVAALATARLAEIVSEGHCSNKQAAADLSSSQCFHTLIQHLSSTDRSLKETTTVALSALTDMDLLDHSLLDTDEFLNALEALLEDRSEDIRATAACILHSYFRNSSEAKAKIVAFQQGRLLKKLVAIILHFSRLSRLNLHLSHLRDLMLDKGAVSPSRVKQLEAAGLSTCLTRLEGELVPQSSDQRIKITELGFTQFVLGSLKQLRLDLSVSN